MFEAQLHGKLPKDVWLRNEDLLTSAVFGTLKNLPGWVTSELLTKAKPLKGDRVISIEAQSWEFWPWWTDEEDETSGCEPDVVISSADVLCVIEAKLFASFGSEPGKRDQLDRQWLQSQVRRRDREFALLTVTNHLRLPSEEITEQFSGPLTAYDPTRIFWLSWSDIARYLESADLGQSDRLWCADLLELVDVLGIGPFRGFADVVHDAAGALSGALPKILANPDLGSTDHDVGFADLIHSIKGVYPSLRRSRWME